MTPAIAATTRRTERRFSPPPGLVASLVEASQDTDDDEPITTIGTRNKSPKTVGDASKPILTFINDGQCSVEAAAKPILSALLPWAGLAVWPLMLALPLLLTSPFSPTSYEALFPPDWYAHDPANLEERPKPLGLVLGILAVALGQLFVLIYFYLHANGRLSFGGDCPPAIQTKGAPIYDFAEGVVTHLSQPEGFVLLGAYLSITWLCNLMPKAYYSFEGGIQYHNLALCLVVQDGIQYTMHRLEHGLSPTIYQKSHKPHHKFTNPRMFDAFNGSLADTTFMILVPLFVTANLVQTCNVWTYMAFGSTYANWLTMIHSEYIFPWDCVFRLLGLGTPGDHHVHHKFFKYNYGHLFMWFDMIGGTYRDPRSFGQKAFNEGA